MVVVVLGALAIGLTLGLLGSGGSAVTVPVLVYLVGHDVKQSIAESMAIVGLISLVAAFPYGRHRLIDWTSVWYFGIPGMFGTFAGAWLGGLAPGALQLAVFGTVLVVSAFAMFKKSTFKELSSEFETKVIQRSSIAKIGLEGTIVGIITGFVGVGGGFLIVPALVLLGKLPIRMAIGTSLVIIALKSAIGFIKYQHHLLTVEDRSVDPSTLLIFSLIGIVGSWAGQRLNARINQELLKRLFAIFLMVLGIWLFFSEGSKLISPADSSPEIPLVDRVDGDT